MPRIHKADDDLRNLTLAELRIKYLDKLVRYRRNPGGSWHGPTFIVEVNYHWNWQDRVFFKMSDQPWPTGEPRPREGNWLDTGYEFQIAGED